MKKAVSFFASHLLLGFYALAAILALLCCLLTAAWDGLGYATGRLHTQEYALESLPVQDIMQTDDGLWVTVGPDPQVLIAADQPIRTVTWTAQNDTIPAQAEGYYAKNGEDFSLRNRVWAKADAQTGEGAALRLDFPLSGGNTVRIDPTGEAGIVLANPEGGTTLTVNAPRPFFSYFCLRAQQVFWLLLVPAVAAAATDWVRSVRAGRKKAAPGIPAQDPHGGKEKGAE